MLIKNKITGLRFKNHYKIILWSYLFEDVLLVEFDAEVEVEACLVESPCPWVHPYGQEARLLVGGIVLIEVVAVPYLVPVGLFFLDQESLPSNHHRANARVFITSRYRGRHIASSKTDQRAQSTIHLGQSVLVQQKKTSWRFPLSEVLLVPLILDY